MKKSTVWMGVVMLLMMPVCLWAGTVIEEDYVDLTPCSDEGDAQIQVYSLVEYDDASGLYTYTYQITGASDLYVSTLEIQLLESASVVSGSVAYSGSGVDPTLWTVADPALNVTAVFLTPMIGEGSTSSLLVFQSYDAPTKEVAVITAQYAGDGEIVCLCGEVWTPIPEPATMGLLALGALSVIRRKRK